MINIPSSVSKIDLEFGDNLTSFEISDEILGANPWVVYTTNGKDYPRLA
jgi:hypothetical protein